MSKTLSGLTPELIEFLQGEQVITLITTDIQNGQPNLDVISWLVAGPNGDKINFAVGHKATSAINIQHNPQVILGVIGAGGCYAVKGVANVSDVMEKTMKIRVVTVDIHSVEDVMFYGGKITVVPEYIKTYNKDLAEKLDHEVYGLLKEML